MSIEGPYNEGMLIYEPKHLSVPPRWLAIPPSLSPSSWRGLGSVIDDVLERFGVKRKVCLELGVEYGYSAVAFSNFFDKVIGVDTFTGDQHSGIRTNFFETTKELLSPYKNIQLVNLSWEGWAAQEQEPQTYDLIHIDVEHTYEMTMAAGSWAVQHSPISLFHDTISFPQVSWACADIANKFGKKYWNYTKHFGLGIIV